MGVVPARKMKAENRKRQKTAGKELHSLPHFRLTRKKMNYPDSKHMSRGNLVKNKISLTCKTLLKIRYSLSAKHDEFQF